ncbi:hypothetical protein BDQ17DRAFT_1499901, partial [Cyathus striatus]
GIGFNPLLDSLSLLQRSLFRRWHLRGTSQVVPSPGNDFSRIRWWIRPFIFPIIMIKETLKLRQNSHINIHIPIQHLQQPLFPIDKLLLCVYFLSDFGPRPSGISLVLQRSAGHHQACDEQAMYSDYSVLRESGPNLAFNRLSMIKLLLVPFYGGRA